MTRKCTIENCERKYHAKGFCQHHYEKRFNNTVAKEGEKQCENEECNLRHYAKGLCKKHYSRQQMVVKKEEYNEAARKYRRNNPEQHLLNITKTRAKQRNLEFNLEVSDIHIPDICPVLKVKLNKNAGPLADRANRASVDRIDSSKGYIKGNVRIISWRANYVKGNSTLDELKKVTKWLEEELNN